MNPLEQKRLGGFLFENNLEELWRKCEMSLRRGTWQNAIAVKIL